MNYHNSHIKIKPCKHCGKLHDFGRCGVKDKGKRPRIRRKIAPQSAKQGERVSEYHRIKKEFLHSATMCQVKSKHCTGAAIEVHHSQGRIGENLTDVTTFVATCRACHVYIEKTGEGVKWAKEQGFVKTRI